MRVLYVATRQYDFVAASIVEGMHALAADGELEFVTTEYANYARSPFVWPASRIKREARSFDVAILGTNRYVNRELFETVAEHAIPVCIDGGDDSVFTHDPGHFKVYFKRELPASGLARTGIYPCPIAVENRWWSRPDEQRPIVLSACFFPRAGLREDVLSRLQSLCIPNARLGGVVMRWRDRFEGVLRGQCSWSVVRRHPHAVGHNRRYYRTLRQSQMSVSVPGVGWDTGRWWEIIGSGALLLSPSPAIRMPDPFESGTHFIGFGDVDYLEDTIASLMEDPGTIERIRLAGYEHARRHHSTRARAKYVMNTIMESV